MNVLKRNGKQVEYDGSKIILAIQKAMSDVNTLSEEVAQEIEDDIFSTINSSEEAWTVEEISDEIEKQLMHKDLYEVAKSFILFRNDRDKKRSQRWEMSELQSDIYNQKYRHNNESFDEFLERISGGNSRLKKIIRDKKFLFGGRILANRKLNELDNRKITLSNCYVITPPEDNLESIFDTAKKLARTYSYGGGCGIDISKLRPSGAKVNNNAETTSGAVSFMDLYSLTTGLIGQKGRRGALMISISSSHPDIEEFIDIKSDLERVTKANISIFADDEFLSAVESKRKHMTKFFLDDGTVIEKEVDAYKIFNKLAFNSWDIAEPAILFKDRIDNYHLLQYDEDFEFAGVNP
jgi:ribonucleoside-diphosphate reductase alpha chain